MLRLFGVLRHLGILKTLHSTTQFAATYMQHGASLYTVFAWAAWRYRHQTALVAERRLTYAELRLEVERHASSLLELGLPKNATLHLAVANPERLMVLLLAGLRLGFEMVLHNPKQPPQEDNLITDQTTLPKPTSPLPRIKAGRVTLLTSGSTGAPKRVRQKRLQPLVLAGLLERLSLGVGQRILLMLPLFHGHGLATLALSVISGSELHLRRLEPEQVGGYITQEKINVLLLVPTILYRLLEAQTDFKVNAIICGSAPLEPQLVTRAQMQFGQVLFNLYGSTETGLISLATPQDLTAMPHSVGKPLRRLDLIGGQIVVDGITTGDLGRLEHGFLVLLGRSDEMFFCGGVNVYPQHLEQQIGQLEGIKECAVLGIPDAEYGFAVRLYVVLHPQTQLETLYQHCATILPKAQRPKEIIQLETLPRNVLGKLQRHLLDS
jgi:acyl-CoA synthetase (AMP-forming)/AMP-acid ligase II